MELRNPEITHGGSESAVTMCVIGNGLMALAPGVAMFCYPRGLVVGLLAIPLITAAPAADAIEISSPQTPLCRVLNSGFTAWQPLELLENSFHDPLGSPEETLKKPSYREPLLSLQPVPEPYAYIMAAFGLIGLLGMGTVVRRRKGIPARARTVPAALAKGSEGLPGRRSRNKKTKTAP